MQDNSFDISNRRYIGSKAKLVKWIFENLNLENIESICDIFAGSGVIASNFTKKPQIKNIILNDLLYSNELIYSAFLLGQNINFKPLLELTNLFNNKLDLKPNYFSDNFSDKFFSYNDCLKIGSIREYIAFLQIDDISKNILLASLIYSMDKIANTVGHYEAYRKSHIPQDKFVFKLIKPIKHNKTIQIYRQNANNLAKEIKADLIFIDPPYNSRQYSRFYHIYENLVEWKKPKLSGIALKPIANNMSEYCRSNASKELENLIANLKCKKIALTYNNTYNSKSKSSQNKISFSEIENILKQKGKVTIKEKKHNYFNTGKTKFNEHKEYLFIVEVK
ncbi:DNA adenine methylase [Campylobacter lari]|uniref:DNA adenine methylase n=1 Tax=Campylobacter lari TaxID=201 RepID=UPI00180A777E|nr:adenine methyltransferase [Campylobacter lari]